MECWAEGFESSAAANKQINHFNLFSVCLSFISFYVSKPTAAAAAAAATAATAAAAAAAPMVSSLQWAIGSLLSKVPSLCFLKK